MKDLSVVQLTFTAVDWVVVGIYGVLILFLGLRGSRFSRSSAEEFLLGGRMLTLPAFVASLVSTWYGGILGVGEYSYEYGLSNWLVFGMPYYVFAAVFAFLFARRIRESGVYSIPERLLGHYGQSVSLLGSVFVFFLTSPAPYFLMLAILIQVATGWSFLPSLIVGTVVAVVYVYAGGFRSVVRTDLLQFVLMFAGFALLLMYLVPNHGFNVIQEQVPRQHLTATGGQSWQYVVVWFFIALWTLVAPQFHQFALAAKSPAVARSGILVSIFFWMCFDAMTTASGLFARALLPDLANPTMAYPALAEQVLPPVAKSLFFVGMLATVMSTTDCLTLIAAMTAGRDIAARWKNRMDDRSVNLYSQIGIVVTALLSIGAILLFPSVIELWYVIGTLFIPALLLPVLTTYYEGWRITSRQTLIAMIAGFVGSGIWFLLGELSGSEVSARYPLNIEPMYAGLVLSILLYVIFGFIRKNQASPGAVHSRS